MKEIQQEKYLLQSVSRAFDILDCFSSQHPEWGVTELTNHLRMNKSAVHKVLMTLLENGFVKQKPSRKYVLGPRIVQLSRVYLERLNVVSIAQPVMRRLAEANQKTCHLAKLHETEIVYLLTLRAPGAFHFSVLPSLRAPVYCTALGKVLLAFENTVEQDRILRKIQFEKKMPNTISTRGAFKRHLRQVRQQGFAVDDEEHTPNLRCVAAPIRNSQGFIEAGLSLAGHKSDISDAVLSHYIREILIAAREISAQMGFDGDL